MNHVNAVVGKLREGNISNYKSNKFSILTEGVKACLTLFKWKVAKRLQSKV